MSRKRSVCRILSLLLSAALLLGLLPAAVHAAPADDVTARPLKILCIGHSYAIDAMNYLFDVAAGEGLSVTLGIAYYSGCSLQQHVNFFKNGSSPYTFYYNSSGAWKRTANSTLLDCLTAEPWDLIVLQQGPFAAGQPESHAPYLDELIDYVNEHKTNSAARFLWHMTWAVQWDCILPGFERYFQKNQAAMYEAITDTVQSVIVPRSDFVGIIPSGTAVQNARTSYFGDTLTRDGHHMSELGRLITAYTWYCALTGKTLDQLHFVNPSVNLSASDRAVVTESVNHAMQTPFAVTPSAYVLGGTPHYRWAAGADASANAAALADNLSADPGIPADLRWTEQGVFTGEDGSFELISHTLYNDAAAYGDLGYYGLPRTVSGGVPTAAEPLRLDLCQMEPLDTDGLAAVSLTMDWVLDEASAAAMSGRARVQVSLDGTSWLPGGAEVRAVTLLGAGSTDRRSKALVYRLYTENLLDIPGLSAGDVIRGVRILPDGPESCVPGLFGIRSLSVDCYRAQESFTLSVPETSGILIGSAAGAGTYSQGVVLAAAAADAVESVSVSLRDLATDQILYSESFSGGAPALIAGSAQLDQTLAALPDGLYRLSVSAGAQTRQAEFHIGMERPCYGVHTGWTALTQASIYTLQSFTEGAKTYYVLPAGSYYLAEDVDFDATLCVQTNNEVNLCLNGHALRGTLHADADHQYYNYGLIALSGTLNLCDHTGEGKLQINADGEITSNTYAAYVLYSTYGTFNFYSGSICDSRGRYGVVMLSGNTVTMNMYGGVISDNVGTTGAGVRVGDGATLQMSGGEIRDNQSSKPGAGVYLEGTGTDEALFVMTGGVISGNRATATSQADSRGGGVAVNPYGTFDFSGGTITGNSAQLGAGVYLTGTTAAMEMTYYAAITGNTGTVSAGGVCVTNGASVAMADGTIADNTAPSGIELLAASNGTTLSVTGGVIGAEGSSNTITFRGNGNITAFGEFTGGVIRLPVATDGTGTFQVALRAGDFAGIAPSHAGITAYGGRYASDACLAECAAEGLAVADSGDPVFRYTLAAAPAAEAGDLNGDGKVNGKDAVMLQRFVAGGYGTVLDEAAADLNGDGKVNAKDAVMLQRFIAGGYGVEL